MADETPNLLLPYLIASQAQKHVTHNEALRLLDGLTQLAVEDRDLAAPPGAPAEGACWIVGSGATGEWTGWDGDVAMWADGAWLRLPARIGWRAWVVDEGQLVVRGPAGWAALGGGGGGPAPDVDVAVGPAGGTTGLAVAEELLSGLAGASVDSSIVIPDRAIVLGVSTRTVTADHRGHLLRLRHRRRAGQVRRQPRRRRRQHQCRRHRSAGVLRRHAHPAHRRTAPTSPAAPSASPSTTRPSECRRPDPA